MADFHYRSYLPPYRSLVNPNVIYDYQTHSVIHLSPSEINKFVARFQMTQSQKPKSALQMKYRSLLSDVSMKASLIGRKVSGMKSAQSAQSQYVPDSSCRRCTTFKQLPVEIQIAIFSYVDDPASYRNCLFASKKFYELAKPFVWRSASFTSTYRFAQFVTCLRLNPTLGSYVLEVDLSGLQPGNAGVEIAAEEHYQDADGSQNPEEICKYLSQVLAGWRDWKFKNNLNALHPVAIPLSRSSSNLPVVAQTQNTSKRIKLSSYFKRRKSHTNVAAQNTCVSLPNIHSQHTRDETNGVHPRTNRFLLNYASSKDVPIGYVLHLINLCPNLKSLNLANISLSNDYRVKRIFQSRYQTYDLTNNYHKDMLKILDSVLPSDQEKDQSPLNSTFRSSFADITSSASSVFSIGTFSKPVRKYNSLLPPVNLVSPDIHYACKGDGNLFLSDLSLKAINTSHWEIISQSEVFKSLQKRQTTLYNLNMSSMIWVNLTLVRDYLTTVLASDLSEEIHNGRKVITFRNKIFEIGESFFENDKHPEYVSGSDDFVFDLRNSGMNKNLPWAQKINTGQRSGQRLIYRILNDELVSVNEENLIRERIRRGRAGENYFA